MLKCTVAPTVRMRYRVETRWLRKPLVVLQIEERHTSKPHFAPEYTFLIWRDATVGDITIGEQH